jgi:predicted RNA methylase
MTTPAYLPGMESEARDPALSQWFTDPALAERVWRWANRSCSPRSVLEPSCGAGALLRPIAHQPHDCERVMALDIDRRMVAATQGWIDEQVGSRIRWTTARADFLASPVLPNFDLVLMNPPYEDGQAEAFVLHALEFAPRVVGIFKAAIQHGAERFERLWSRAVVTREVRLARRPSFGRGTSGSKQGETDFVVLEVQRGNSHGPHAVLREMWP